MNKLEVFDSLKDTAQLGGGSEKIEMQHNLNKLTARERILSLLDEGSFIEVGSFISKNGAGVITGYGTVEGRLIFVYSHDYTVDGGTFTKAMGSKITNIIDKAAKVGAPIVQIIDSIGGKITEGVELLSSYGAVIGRYGKLSGVIPRISVVCGPCNGIMAVLSAMSDITVAVNDISDLSVSSLSKLISKEEVYVNEEMISNGKAANENGNAHINANNEEEAFDVTRKIISYMPSNNLELPLISEEDDKLNEAKDNLDSMVEKNSYSLDEILASIVDINSIIEISKEFAKNFRTVLAKINGLTVGIILNAENKEVDNEGAKKAASFVRLCDSFNISILTLVDTKGATISISEEKNGLAKNIGKLMYSLVDTKVPKVSLVIGEAYGLGYELLASKEGVFDVTVAWPTAKICLTSPEAYIKGLYTGEILEKQDPREGEREVISKYYDEVTSPYRAAEVGLVDDIIKPSESKQRIFAILDMLQSKREVKYPKVHGTTLI